MDKICLRGMEVFGHHGVAPEERALGQTLVIDLEVACDLSAAGRSDAVEETLSYVELVDVVRDVVETTPFRLLEAIAEEIAARVLQWPRALGVTVRVEKPRPPIPHLKGAVAIEIARQKG